VRWGVPTPERIHLRLVRDEAVETVMRHFFAEHQTIDRIKHKPTPNGQLRKISENVQCEEALLEAFGQ